MVNQDMVELIKTFNLEIDEVCGGASLGIKKIMLSDKRIAKHPPLTWLDETEDEHLRKGIRHVLTYQLQRDGQQTKDEEDHLALALCRLAMAYSKRLRK